MFWADKIVDKIKDDLKDQIKSGKPLIIRDEKTASGRIHIGSMRGVALHGIISEILSEQNIKNTFLYEINDFDPMDGLPSYLDEQKYKEHMGKPLFMVPSPDGKAKNYAEYFAQEFIDVIRHSGFTPEYYRASELYKSGRMNEVIKIALEKAPEIRAIYKKISGSIKPDDWLPLNVVCEKCGKLGTTKVTSFDGEKVTYTCIQELVSWAEGCGYEGVVSPYNGNAKLPWKVEWAAKFVVLEVLIEGAGKDHSTRGGSREVADTIAEKIFNYKPPFDIPYEFFLVGGKKMSSSKGEGSSAREIADLLPRHIFRLAFLGKNIKQAIDFIPDGDTIPVLYDRYDELSLKYFNEPDDDGARLFALIHSPEKRKNLEEHFMPRFSLVSFLVQMPHMNIDEEVSRMKGGPLTNTDREEIASRAEYARKWLASYAPENFKYELQSESVPEAAQNFNEEQKNALKKVLKYIESHDDLDGQELHTALHDIKKETEINPKEFFGALYLSFIGKESGPKAGWFLSVLDREFLTRRLREVSG